MEITEIKRWISSRKGDSRTVFFQLDVYMGMFAPLGIRMYIIEQRNKIP